MFLSIFLLLFSFLLFLFKTEIQFRIIFDSNLGLLDFKTNLTGYCYIQKNTDPQANIAEYRKQLVKLHNVFATLYITFFIIYKN